MAIVPVILSGGSGSRLWPLSRKEYPKQYLSLLEDGSTLFQATVVRLKGIDNLLDPVVICNVEHRFLVAQQLHEIGIQNFTILLEVSGKNTAPAIAAAASFVSGNLSISAEDQLLVLSADHDIQDVDLFHRAIKVASRYAAEGNLVTFGVTPVEPHTGYGYIEINLDRKGSDVENADLLQAYSIHKFVEKPDKETAQQYLEGGGYLWNSGMFLFEVGRILEEFSQYAPQIMQAAAESVERAQYDCDFVRLALYADDVESISIDCAIMEKTAYGVVVPLSAQWSDVGSWNALWERGDKDQSNNCILGDAIVLETQNSYVHADHHMVVTIGVDDLIVVDTPDATLVSAKSHSQQIKTVVEQLEQDCHHLAATHRKVFRPWGWYDVIDQEAGFKVKRICVNPGGCLSLQSHKLRSEHWIVVSGVATVTRDNETFTINENMSTYIPIGMKHRLQNCGDLPLELVEVQVGGYLEEDDIERFEDRYNR